MASQPSQKAGQRDATRENLNVLPYGLHSRTKLSRDDPVTDRLAVNAERQIQSNQGHGTIIKKDLVGSLDLCMAKSTSQAGVSAVANAIAQQHKHEKEKKTHCSYMPTGACLNERIGIGKPSLVFRLEQGGMKLQLRVFPPVENETKVAYANGRRLRIPIRHQLRSQR